MVGSGGKGRKGGRGGRGGRGGNGIGMRLRVYRILGKSRFFFYEKGLL